MKGIGDRILTHIPGLRNTSPIHRGNAGDFADKVGWGLWEELNLVPLALCPSASHLYTFSLSFPLCKMGIITGLLECNGKGYGQGSIQPLTYGKPFRMVALGRLSMRGEGLLDALHLGWKVDQWRKEWGRCPSVVQKVGETPGHVGGLCGPPLERAGQAFAESGDRGDRNVILTTPRALGLSHDIIPHAACLSAFLSLLKPHWSEQRRMAHGPCPGNGTPGGAGWIPGQLSSCSPQYSGARLPGFEFWLPPCLSCVTLGELFNLSVPVFPAAK